MTRFEDTLVLHSPRYQGRSTPAASLFVHGAVGVVWLLLFASAFAAGGIYAWSTGIAYIVYDTVLLAFVAWKTWSLLRPAAPARNDAALEKLTVVVAAHDESAVLVQTISALLAQAEPPDAIVIADDGSTDATETLLVTRFRLVAPALGDLATSTTVPSLHWLRLAHGGKARALNAALDSPIDACRTTIAMTVDADTHLAPGAIAAMRRAFTADPS
ncbi:MAG TPA: glycosyltransferase family 2 protein, partial [Kofleriaceae bacterium]